MRVSISRQIGRSLVFIAAVELQGNGNPHLHLLVGSYLHKDWISQAWQAVGGGWATRIEYSDLHRVAAYLAKYITDESACSVPLGTRRYSSSKGLAIFVRSGGESLCVLLKSPIEQVFHCADGVSDMRFETYGDTTAIVAFIADRLDGLLSADFGPKPRVTGVPF